MGSLILIQGVLLFRIGVAGPPGDLEQLAGVVLLLAIGVAGAWLIGAEGRRTLARSGRPGDGRDGRRRRAAYPARLDERPPPRPPSPSRAALATAPPCRAPPWRLRDRVAGGAGLRRRRRLDPGRGHGATGRFDHRRLRRPADDGRGVGLSRPSCSAIMDGLLGDGPSVLGPSLVGLGVGALGLSVTDAGIGFAILTAGAVVAAVLPIVMVRGGPTAAPGLGIRRSDRSSPPARSPSWRSRGARRWSAHSRPSARSARSTRPSRRASGSLSSRSRPRSSCASGAIPAHVWTARFAEALPASAVPPLLGWGSGGLRPRLARLGRPDDHLDRRQPRPERRHRRRGGHREHRPRRARRPSSTTTSSTSWPTRSSRTPASPCSRSPPWETPRWRRAATGSSPPSRSRAASPPGSSSRARRSGPIAVLDLGGWARRSPLLGLALVLVLIGAVGLPGMAAFDARADLIRLACQARSASSSW